MSSKRAPRLSTEPRRDEWESVVSRDARADGAFVYAVTSTGIYCRPSCPSRPKRRENVRFFPTIAEAEKAGFRACKRCTPNGASFQARQAAMVESVCRYIDRCDESPKLVDLAKRAKMSPHHFQRTFKAITGVTPSAYVRAQRMKRVRAELQKKKGVTEAMYTAGYASSGRFYEESNRALGMTPSAYRNGGAGVAIRFAVGACSLGKVLIACTDRGVCHIALGNTESALVRELNERFPEATVVRSPRSMKTALTAIVRAADRPGASLDLALDIRGTAFQERVWNALRAIPLGSTKSYAEIARAIGSPTAVRAVGTACGANTIAIAIPCHRAVRTDGSISGYRWGTTRKRELLKRELSVRGESGRK